METGNLQAYQLIAWIRALENRIKTLEDMEIKRIKEKEDKEREDKIKE